MAASRTVYNISKKCFWKRSYALKSINNCACEWVEEDRTVRDLTLAEAIAARNVQAKLRDPMPMGEIPGLVFRQPGNVTEAWRFGRLMRDADAFAVSMGCSG